MITLYIITALMFTLCLAIYPLFKKKTKVAVYSKKRYKKTHKTFLFAKTLVAKTPNGLFFYAELDGDIFFIFNKNSWVRLKIDAKNINIKNANNSFIRGNCSQNESAYYMVNRLHSIVNFSCGLSIWVNNVAFEWDSEKSVLKFGQSKLNYCITLSGDFSLSSSSKNKLSFCVGNLLINYSTCGFLALNSRDKKEFLNSYFGYICTSKWESTSKFGKYLKNEDSLEKRYFKGLIEVKECCSIANLNHFSYSEVGLGNTIFLIPFKKFRIDLTKLGIADVIVLKTKHNLIKLECLITGFVFYLKFGKPVVSAHLGCVLGTLWLYVSLSGASSCEIYPFSLDFPLSLFTDSSIKRFISNDLNYKYLNFPNAFSLNNVLNILNYQIICGNLEGCQYCASLHFEFLNEDCKFYLSNLLLSWACVSGELFSRNQQRMVLYPLKNLNNYKRSEIFCFFNKLLKVIKNDNLKIFIKNIIDGYFVIDKNNFEFVFCYLLGVKIFNGLLTVEDPLIKFDAKLKIKNKTISILNSKRNAILIDGIEYINKTKVNLQTENIKTITFQCSSEKN